LKRQVLRCFGCIVDTMEQTENLQSADMVLAPVALLAEAFFVVLERHGLENFVEGAFEADVGVGHSGGTHFRTEPAVVGMDVALVDGELPAMAAHDPDGSQNLAAEAFLEIVVVPEDGGDTQYVRPAQ